MAANDQGAGERRRISGLERGGCHDLSERLRRAERRAEPAVRTLVFRRVGDDPPVFFDGIARLGHARTLVCATDSHPTPGHPGQWMAVLPQTPLARCLDRLEHLGFWGDGRVRPESYRVRPPSGALLVREGRRERCLPLDLSAGGLDGELAAAVSDFFAGTRAEPDPSAAAACPVCGRPMRFGSPPGEALARARALAEVLGPGPATECRDIMRSLVCDGCGYGYQGCYPGGGAQDECLQALLLVEVGTDPAAVMLELRRATRAGPAVVKGLLDRLPAEVARGRPLQIAEIAARLRLAGAEIRVENTSADA